MIPETQLDAYRTIKKKDQKQNIVFRAIHDYGGLTFFELVKILDWQVNKITGRVNELVSKGLVQDSGKRRINPDSNKSGIIWSVKNGS